MQNESDFSQALIKLIEPPAVVLNVHGHAMQKKGISDLLIWSRFWTGGAELKFKQNRPSKLQRRWLNRLRKVNTEAWVLRAGRIENCVEVEHPDGQVAGYITNWLDMTGREFLEELSRYESY